MDTQLLTFFRNITSNWNLFSYFAKSWVEV